MGVRARRWQLWLITTFILTGMIGMIQLFKGPESAGAVTIAGGAADSSVAIPARGSDEATKLPAWTPTDDATVNTASSQSNSVPKVAAATTRPTVASGATNPPGVIPARTQATQLPSNSATQSTAATKTTIIAKSISTSPTATTPAATTAAPTTTKPATTTPAATATKPVATSTKPVATTTKPAAKAAKPTPTPVRTTTTAPTRTRTQPPTTRCYRILWWTVCR